MSLTLCSVSNVSLMSHGHAPGTWLSGVIEVDNQLSTAQTKTLTLSYNPAAHQTFRPCIEDDQGNRLWTLGGNQGSSSQGYWYINRNLNVKSYQTGSGYNPNSVAIGTSPIIESATITFQPGINKIKIGADNNGANNGDYNYGSTHIFNGVTNCQSIIDSMTNVAPTSYFLAQSEGLVGKITDYSTDSDGTIVRWKFDFGNNVGPGTYIGADPTDLTNTTAVTRYLIFDANDNASVADTPPGPFYYRFNTAGDKTISLEVTDNAGATHSSSLDAPGHITVENLDPSAGFTFLTYRDNKKLDVEDLSDDLDGVIVKWEWDWGDGNTDTWTTATKPTNGEYTHTYALNGVYDVTLTVTDDVGATNAQTVTIDVPRATASIIFSQSGPVSMGFSILASVSSVNPENDQYRGPSFLAWSRTVDVQSGRDDATEIAAHDDVFKSIIPVDPLPTGYTQAQVDAYGYPRDPLSLKDLTVEGASTYEVDYLAPADAAEPYGIGEWLGAEIPQPGVASPEPPDMAIGSNGLYSVAFDNETYFKIFVDTSGSMNSYVGAYHAAAQNVAAEMTDVFFGGDEAVARKYVQPSQNISNERWAQWAMTTLYQPGEPQKQVIIAAINEDDSGPGGTNAAIQAKAQAMFDSGGHYYFIMVQPPGGGYGPMMSMGPALAQTRVTVGTGANQEQLRWAQFAYETANGGALTNVIKQILGFLPA